MNTDIIISIRNLSKAYKTFHSQTDRLKYYLLGKDNSTPFFALQDIGFEVRRGETLGIIGKNGSGKSTLLQLLTGIITATSGSIDVKGQVAALLELGSGFNPESTGLENIYMNGAILGLEKKRVDQKLKNIIEFADIGDFINNPVKTYSSGMYIRLAFAVAINVDADIIVIDEALAVGDIFFRQKCYARLNQLKEQGKTIILVTHGMGEVEQFCDRAILLNNGKMIVDGNSNEVVKQYYLLNQEGVASAYTVHDSQQEKQPDQSLSTEQNQMDIGEFAGGWHIQEPVFFDLSHIIETSNGKATIIRVGLFGEDGYAKRVFEQGESAFFYCEAEVLDTIEVPIFGLLISNQKNILVYGKDNLQTDSIVPQTVKKHEIIRALLKVKLNLASDEYTFEVGVGSMSFSDFNNRSNVSQEDIFTNTIRICNRCNLGVFAVIVRKEGNPTRMSHYGVCDLPTCIEINTTNSNG